MEDDDIRVLFKQYQPELSPESLFLSKLKKNMEAVEIVKQHTKAIHKRSRLAIAVAAVAGFVMGVVFMLLMPLIGEAVSTIHIRISGLAPLSFSINWQMAGWVITAIVSIFTAINAYEITAALAAKNKVQA